MSQTKNDLFGGRNRGEDTELHKENESVRATLKQELVLGQLLGESPAMREIRGKIARISFCDINILILGESGTGKELAARTVHYLSPRSRGPFIPVNCGAIPENLFENELFGHAKGAYTDARFKQKGLVEEAQGGTIFLDEIGVISPSIQAKLLRLLQDKEYKPLGNSRVQYADIRILAASNKSLFRMLQEGSFREDLYYRLNIVQLVMPPLRERKDDIPLLIEHFTQSYAKKYGLSGRDIPPRTLEMFVRFDWPGNIRELENKVQQWIVLPGDAEKSLAESSLEFPGLAAPSSKRLSFHRAKKQIVDTFEKEYLYQVLIRNNGNVVNAAKDAGKSRTSLWNLMKKHAVSPKPFRQTSISTVPPTGA